MFAGLLRVLVIAAAATALADAANGETDSGKTFRDCANCPEMLVIPAGSFEMGSPASEMGRFADEGPQHRVTIAQPFALGKFEVTVGEFRHFVLATGLLTDAQTGAGGKKGCYGWKDGRLDWHMDRHWENPGFAQSEQHPATCLSWNDAQLYVNWLASITGRLYRLPSAAEWEYAARAATTTTPPWSDGADHECKHHNITDTTKGPGGRAWSVNQVCSDGYFFPAPVGSYRANGFGLHDMIGNVWEWTQDCRNANHRGAPVDGRARTGVKCQVRELRGGSWFSGVESARTARRIFGLAESRVSSYGFRVARVLPVATGTAPMNGAGAR